MKYLFFATVTVLTLLNSCARSHYLYIDVRESAPIMFTPDIKKIILADNSFISNATDPTFGINNRSFIVKDVVDTARQNILKSLAKYMNEEKYYDTVVIFPYYPKPLYVYEETTKQNELPLTKEEVIDICSQTESDALISLDLLRILFRDKRNWNSFSIRIEAKIRAYSHDGTLQGNPVRLGKQNASSTVIMKQEDLLYPLLTECSQWIADMLTDSLIPKWETQRRVYYTNFPNLSLRKISRMGQKEWASAAASWQEAFYKEKKWKKKVKYASNTALSYEYIDDIESAVKWINRAYDLLPPNSESSLANNVKYYRIMLTKRYKRLL